MDKYSVATNSFGDCYLTRHEYSKYENQADLIASMLVGNPKAMRTAIDNSLAIIFSGFGIEGDPTDKDEYKERIAYLEGLSEMSRNENL